MKRDLRDRVIVITGASSGIGAATAVACARAGMDVVLAARREEKLQQVADQVRRHGRRAMAVVCDVTQDEQVDRLVEQTVDAWGRLDVMFANAGHGLFASIESTTDAQMRAIFETNYYGMWRCIRAAVPIMRRLADDRAGCGQPALSRRSDRGHIVICSSVVSEVGLPMHGAYCATKAAQDAMASSLRAELAHEGIAVSSVHPIGTRTEFSSVVRQGAGGDTVPQQATADRFMQSPDHVARAVVRCLRRPCPEVWPHLPTRWGIAIGTAWPQLTALAMRMLMHRLQARRD